MPARGSGKPAIQRGVRCSAGHDEWREVSGRGFACAPCDRQRCKQYQRKQAQDNPFEKMWRRAKERAEMAQVPFLLTVEDIVAVWPMDGKCPALGIQMERGVGFSIDASPTLDRLNGENGYEPGNIAVISLRANRAKNTLRAFELEQIARWMQAQGLD